MSDYRLDTKCVQGGYRPGNGEPRQIPIVQSTTFRYETSEAMGRLFDLEEEGYFYSRLQNPTNDTVARKICELEGGSAAMLTSSGQAASFYAVFNIASCGDHIVSSSSIYGGTYNLFAVTMKRMGIDFTFVSPDCTEEELNAAFQPNTKLMFGETIANPALTVLDIELFAKHIGPNVKMKAAGGISSIDDALEDLEEELLTITDENDIGIQIQSLRRQYMLMKKSILPLKEQYVKLLRAENLLIHKVNRAFFNDVNDHLLNVAQNIDICRETLSSLMDLYISNNDLRMNDIMKRLTVVSTIFIPLTFLVGVWGMNFRNMPELEWEHGYILAWGVMIVIGFVTYLFFRTKKWR